MRIQIRFVAALLMGIFFVISTIACSQSKEVSNPGQTPQAQGLITHREVGGPNPPTILTIQSSILGEERRVYVQVPEGYSHAGVRYPVLVVVDGEWLFDLARANVRFFSEIDVMDVAIPKMIVVGVENTDRDRDYVPTKDPKTDPDFPTAGDADTFLRFLDRELLPVIDRLYRTAPSRTVVGWSFGGLFALYSAVTMPDLFDAYLCIGPAIWWDDELVFEMYREARFDRPKRMVITLGSREEGGQVDTATKRLLARIEEDPIEGLSVSHMVFDGVGHSWGVPAALDKGLQELFSGFLAPEDVSNRSLDEIEGYYENLSEAWGFQVLPPAPVMQNCAFKEWSDGDAEKAIGVLDRLVQYEPDAALAHYYKGVFQSRQNQKEQALNSFQDALAAELRRGCSGQAQSASVPGESQEDRGRHNDAWRRIQLAGIIHEHRDAGRNGKGAEHGSPLLSWKQGAGAVGREAQVA